MAWIRATQPGWPPQARAKTNAVGNGSIWGWPRAMPTGNRPASTDGLLSKVDEVYRVIQNSLKTGISACKLHL
jgi:hypothetical protein